jgi:hypothetical protein
MFNMGRPLFLFPGEKGMAGEVKTVRRFDAIDPARWMTSAFTRTTDGFLNGRAVVTSIGVFTYRNKDGGISRELRLPEEVFSLSSLETMKLKPVTLDHPDEVVTPDNAGDLQVGTLGSNPTTTNQETDWSGRSTPWEKVSDGIHVAIDMTIQRADAIEEVLNGKRALSMGYQCDIEMAEPGSVWCGMEYDCIQRNIRYNHCAIVDAARAGDAARIRLDSKDTETGDYLGIHLDSKDAVLISNPARGGENKATNQEDKAMKKIRLDSGIEYEGDEGLCQEYANEKKRADTEKARADAAEKSAGALKSTLEAERDSFRDRADKAEKELKELQAQANDPKRLDAAVKEKIDLMLNADRAGVQVKDGMSDTDVKKAVIEATFPGSSVKLDGKDDVYIAARYDTAVEMLEARQDGTSRAVVGDNGLGAASRTDSTAARQRMIKEMIARSRGEKAGE